MPASSDHAVARDRRRLLLLISAGAHPDCGLQSIDDPDEAPGFWRGESTGAAR